ncbi:MAG: Holliday junction resolvase Hjc [Thermofilaceae archaeon]
MASGRGRILTAEDIARMKRRGYQAERDLVRMLRERGYKAVRVPVSAPSGEPLPDLFAVKGDRLLAFEVKSPRSGRAYFYREQIAKLHEFLGMFDLYPFREAVLAAKFPYRWVFKRVEGLRDYVLSRDDESDITL